ISDIVRLAKIAHRDLRFVPFNLLGRDVRLHRRLHATRNDGVHRSEEHTSELQSLMRISYAVFCLKKKKQKKKTKCKHNTQSLKSKNQQRNNTTMNSATHN